MKNCESMGVDKEENIWTVKEGKVIRLSGKNKYNPSKTQDNGLTSAANITVSPTTIYALSLDGSVNRLNNKTWQKLPSRHAQSLQVNENDDLYIVDAGKVYKMSGLSSTVVRKNPGKCYVE